MMRSTTTLRKTAAVAAVLGAAFFFAAWLVRQTFYSNDARLIFSPLHLVFEAVVFALSGFLVIDGCRAVYGAGSAAGWGVVWRPLTRAGTGMGIAVMHLSILAAGGYLP